MSYEFIETTNFSKHIYKYMDDEEYCDLQLYLIANPQIGEVIPKTGGLRKVRWAGSGKGKRGGLRIIYYNRLENWKIYLITIYAKNEIENFSDHELRDISKEVVANE